jgi:hypothetical protein
VKVHEAIAEILRTVQRIEAKVGAAPAGAPAATEGGAVATDADLDSDYGDPKVRKDPPRWKGRSFEGKAYSETAPEFLDELAGFLDWQAGNNNEKALALKGSGDDRAAADQTKYARYSRTDAGRARGWAARMRSGKVGPSGADDGGGMF